MPRVFRHNTERGWIELRRTGAGSSQPPARIYPPKQVKERWETPGGLQVLYELQTGDFARVDFSPDGQILEGYQLPRKGNVPEIRQFFVNQGLMIPWHLSDRSESEDEGKDAGDSSSPS